MRKRAYIGVAAGLLMAAALAPAAIEVKNPLESFVKMGARTIYVGKVTAVSAEQGTFTIAVTETLKGTSPGESVTFNAPKSMLDLLGKDSPVIAYGAGGSVYMHAADNWYIGKASAEKKKIDGIHAPAAQETFPGRTVAIIAATRELTTTGATTLVSKITERLLNGEEHMIQKLAGIKDPTSFVAGDINGDGKADLIVCSAGSVRVFESSADSGSFVHATEKYGLADVKGKTVSILSRAPANTDELAVAIGILVDGVAYDLAKGKFVREEKAGETKTVLAKDAGGGSATGRFGDDNASYVLEVKKEGVFRKSPGGKDAAVDDIRLTGGKITEYHTEQKEKGFVNFQCTAIDANGDGRMDLFIRADGGNLLMINRGFGAFLVDRDSGSMLKTAGLLSSGTLDAKSKRESLLILAADGTVYAVDTKEAPAN